MLSRSEIANEITARTGIAPNLVKHVITSLSEVAAEHVGKGEDLVVPGICKFTWDYRAPQTKGSRWKKGDERTNQITKEVSIAEADSPPVKARARVRVFTAGLVSKAKPGTKPEQQTAFLRTKPGKTVAQRKAK